MEVITNINQLDFDKTYSYADYLLWKFQERLELIKGKIFKMSPAPSSFHQRIVVNLTREYANFFRYAPCQLYVAPFDVRIPNKSGEVKNVVQPDLCVICDLEKIDEKGCLGAPDLVIEILSRGNSKKEMKYKYELYEEAGVKEYWIVEPEYEHILMYVLKDGKYQGLPPIALGEEIQSVLFPDLKINTNDIFE